MDDSEMCRDTRAMMDFAKELFIRRTPSINPFASSFSQDCKERKEVCKVLYYTILYNAVAVIK